MFKQSGQKGGLRRDRRGVRQGSVPMLRTSDTNAGQTAKVVKVLRTPTNAGDSSRRGSLPQVREEHGPKTTIYEVDILGVHVAKVGDGSETHTVSEPTTGAGEPTSVAPLTATGASDQTETTVEATVGLPFITLKPYPTAKKVGKLYRTAYPDEDKRNESNRIAFINQMMRSRGPSEEIFAQMCEGEDAETIEGLRKAHYTVHGTIPIKKRLGQTELIEDATFMVVEQPPEQAPVPPPEQPVAPPNPTDHSNPVSYTHLTLPTIYSV